MTTANSNKELIVKLDKEVALIKKDIDVILNNHLHTIQADIKKINVVLWSVGFAVFSNLIILLRDIIL
jgi:nucleoid DNA-binding protein